MSHRGRKRAPLAGSHIVGGVNSQDQYCLPPEYIRLPKPGARCPHSGLSRTTLIELSVPSSRNGYKPVVESKQLKRRNAKRGIRLINRESLLAHLKQLEA